jgi:hypothetical protein
MTDGRTILKYARVYIDGYDMSGYARTFGPLTCDFGGESMAAISDPVMGWLPGPSTVGIGTLNAFLDNTAGGLHALASGAGVKRTILIAQGMRAIPAAGDPAFMCELEQAGYSSDVSGIFTTVNIPFSNSVRSGALLYPKPWGILVHANAAETGANSANGIDLTDVSTLFGGYMTYQVLAAAGAGNMTATISVEDSASLGSGYAGLVTTGSINCITPVAGIVALARTATVRRYVRWQLALGTATSVTFALGFHRALF